MESFWLLCVCVCVCLTYFFLSAQFSFLFIRSYIFVVDIEGAWVSFTKKKTLMYIKRATKLAVIKFFCENCSPRPLPFSLYFSVVCLCLYFLMWMSQFPQVTLIFHLFGSSIFHWLFVCFVFAFLHKTWIFFSYRKFVYFYCVVLQRTIRTWIWTQTHIRTHARTARTHASSLLTYSV